MPTRTGLFDVAAFDQFDLVAFRRVDERDPAAAARMRTVRERIAFRGRFPRECIEIVPFEGQMRQVGANNDRAALIELTDLNLLLALRRFEEDQLRAATGSVPTDFLQTEHIPVEGDCLLQVFHAITSV